jgi:GNAT superfamily N-acetyltransferase
MLDVASYSVIETLRNGRSTEIRSFKPSDTPDLQSAVGRASPLFLYRRFFTVKREFTEQEKAFFHDVDFVNHVALVALTTEAERSAIVGGGRYVVVRPGKAEVAFGVIDAYQGQGIGAALMRHLTMVASAAGLRELIAEVLAENIPMLKVFEKCGLPINTTREDEYVHVTLRLG